MKQKLKEFMHAREQVLICRQHFVDCIGGAHAKLLLQAECCFVFFIVYYAKQNCIIRDWKMDNLQLLHILSGILTGCHMIFMVISAIVHSLYS